MRLAALALPMAVIGAIGPAAAGVIGPGAIGPAAIGGIAATGAIGPAAAAASSPPAGPPPAAAHPAAPETDARERVLDVTLVPAGAAPRLPAAGREPAAPAAAAGGGTSSRRWSFRGGVAAAIVIAGVAVGLAWRRRHPRCPSCRGRLRRLSGEAAFAALDMAERTEQLVGDVRYEVWRCHACGAIDKRGTAQDLKGIEASALAAPVGSAGFLRRRGQSGLSIWSPPAVRPPAAPWPRPGAAAAALPRQGAARPAIVPPPPPAPDAGEPS